jgi:YLP motif-containing protein 1
MDLSQLLLAPGRNSRPKRLLLLLRGPPGCGKSHVARTIRQMEVSAGGQAPRLHSIDDYFMTEVGGWLVVGA